MIDPVGARLQNDGNVAFGLGQALFEEMVFDGGQLRNGNLADYMVASFPDLPAGSDVSFIEDPRETVVHGPGRDLVAGHRAGHRQRDLPGDRRAHPRPAALPQKIVEGLGQIARDRVPDDPVGRRA